MCELETCFVHIENIWRDNFRPDYGYVYCDCTPVCECEGAKNCHDIDELFNEYVIMYDTNGDMKIDLGDDIDADTRDVLLA
jgi:hypothetical protein